MPLEETVSSARIIIEAIWFVFFFLFMAFTFYMHFFVRPFRHDELFDRKAERFGFNLRVLFVFFLLLVSGFLILD